MIELQLLEHEKKMEKKWKQREQIRENHFLSMIFSYFEELRQEFKVFLPPRNGPPNPSHQPNSSLASFLPPQPPTLPFQTSTRPLNSLPCSFNPLPFPINPPPCPVNPPIYPINPLPCPFNHPPHHPNL